VIKVGTRTFRKCDICGTHGHPKGICPLEQYESQLRTGKGNGVTAEQLFPHNPELVEKLKAREASYRKNLVHMPLLIHRQREMSEIDVMAERLRSAWGIT